MFLSTDPNQGNCFPGRGWDGLKAADFAPVKTVCRFMLRPGREGSWGASLSVSLKDAGYGGPCWTVRVQNTSMFPQIRLKADPREREEGPS